MKRLLALLSLMIAPLALVAQTAPERPLASVESEWRGVHLEISEILRFEPEKILVAVRVRGDETVQNPTFIAGGDRSSPSDPEAIDPYSLASATLVDEATGAAFKAEAHLPRTPFWGTSSILSSINPNTWFQLAISFKVPPPRVAPDGTPVVQTVTLRLPRAKAAMAKVPLPPPGQTLKAGAAPAEP